MQHDAASAAGDRRPPQPCPHCGGALRMSHRRYAGGGASTTVLACTACGRSIAGATRADADRVAEGRGRSRRARPPVDEGPPSNPVLDPTTARRLLEELDG